MTDPLLVRVVAPSTVRPFGRGVNRCRGPVAEVDGKLQRRNPPQGRPQAVDNLRGSLHRGHEGHLVLAVTRRLGVGVGRHRHAHLGPADLAAVGDLDLAQLARRRCLGDRAGQPTEHQHAHAQDQPAPRGGDQHGGDAEAGDHGGDGTDDDGAVDDRVLHGAILALGDASRLGRAAATRSAPPVVAVSPGAR